jgi:hypothetical protein
VFSEFSSKHVAVFLLATWRTVQHCLNSGSAVHSTAGACQRETESSFAVLNGLLEINKCDLADSIIGDQKARTKNPVARGDQDRMRPASFQLYETQRHPVKTRRSEASRALTGCHLLKAADKAALQKAHLARCTAQTRGHHRSRNLHLTAGLVAEFGQLKAPRSSVEPVEPQRAHYTEVWFSADGALTL